MKNEDASASRARFRVVHFQQAEGARVLPFRRPRPRVPSATELYERAYDLEDDSPAEALEAYRRVLEIDPEHTAAHVNLGRLLHANGDVAAAKEHYLRALAAAPDDAIAWFNLGVALDDGERAGDALAAYERALSIEPSMLDAHYHAARLCDRLGRPKDRLRHLSACYRATRRR